MLTWVEIDTAALQANIRAIRGVLPARTAIMAVVKSNAYGHGLQVAAPIVAEVADWLGVNSLDEANALADLGITRPIAILGHSELERLDEVVHRGFRQAVYRRDVAEQLSQCARNAGKVTHAHLKIETGTHRQGIASEDLPGFASYLKSLPNLEIEAAYTHFANIEDTLEPSFAQKQMEAFRAAIRILGENGISPPLTHAAATSGALLYPDAAFNLVRIGIGVYGIWPSRETQIAARERGRQIQLTPALTWKTRLAQIKTIAAGDSVGYGLTYQARRKTTIGILPVGYYDGYDRHLSNSGRIIVREQIVPVVGRVAMNMIAADITDVPAQVDDEVVLLGRQGQAEIRAEELAEKIGTISYEVVSRINPAIPRIAK